MKLPIHASELTGLLAIAVLSVALVLSAPHQNARVPGVQRTAAVLSTPPKVEVPLAEFAGKTKAAMPDFTGYQDVAMRKRAFYRYMLPKIREANAEVMQERRWLLDVAAKLVGEQSLTSDELNGVLALERRYAMNPSGDLVQQVGKLLRRVDIVPASLVMAQAAKESGWGTSRFAVKGKNFFGIWCFSDGCGIRPERRDAGHTHEVATFDSVADGVRYYIRMLNSRPAYKALRSIRASARRQHQLAPGDELAQGLVRYSARGVAYVKEIQSIIHYNNLHRFTIGHLEV